jgi:putative ABC transport system substrate-binding protein
MEVFDNGLTSPYARDGRETRDRYASVNGVAGSAAPPIEWNDALTRRIVIMKKLGFLNSGSKGPFKDYVAAFRKGLTGTAKGTAPKITEAWADGDYKDLQNKAAKLVSDEMHVIAATGGMIAARAAIKATKKIPIVYVVGNAPGPVKAPGSNATGFNLLVGDYILGTLDRLRRLDPKAKDVALLVNPSGQLGKDDIKKGKAAGLIILKAATSSDIKEAIAKAARKAQALIVSPDPFFTSERAQIIAEVAKLELPTAYTWRIYPDKRGLMSYGPDLSKAYWQAGQYAGRLLDGEPISALPTMDVSSDEFKLVINETTAKKLGLKIPPDLRREAEIVK